MGADDEYLDLEHRDLYRKEIRERYGFADDDFVIVTGGRIDKAKNRVEQIISYILGGLTLIKYIHISLQPI